MRSIHETFETFGNRILNLGRSGESRRVTVYVDLSKIANEYPNTSPILKVRAPGTTNAYPAATDYRDGLMAWIISKADTTKEGRGELQLSLVSTDGTIVKTAIAPFEVGQSLSDGGDAPDPIDDWIEKAEVTRKEVEEAGKKALEAIDSIEFLSDEDLEAILK